MGVRVVSLVVELDVVCHDCGMVGRSERLRVQGDGASPGELEGRLSRLRVGSLFPIGWASYWHETGTIYRCPKCIK